MARGRETPASVEAGPPSGPIPPDPATLGYEQARDELVSIVARLESGAGTLEESLALWERGEALAARCQQWLDGARERLTAARGASPSRTDGRPDATDEVPARDTADEDEEAR